jgi:hypothetical protein
MAYLRDVISVRITIETAGEELISGMPLTWCANCRCEK